METFHLSFFAAPQRGMVGAVEDRTTTQVHPPTSLLNYVHARLSSTRN